MPVNVGTENKAPTCNCGADMVLRSGKYGQFYGCSTFPKCRQTRPYNGDNGPKAEPEATKADIVWSAYQQAIFALAEDLARSRARSGWCRRRWTSGS